MKNKIKRGSAFLLVMLLAVISALPIYAKSNDHSKDIKAYLDEAVKKSGVPGMSASVRVGDTVQYFSSGYANREKMIHANEDTLYELASVSKAFTGFGILLLEEQGLLSMDDPIQKYLPWFSLQYNGKPVDMDGVTLNNFLHHSSGLVNSKHYSMLPKGEGPDMLQKTVEAYVDADLAFIPGEKFEYGTMNYDILALVTATVSGESWEEYMQTNVLAPLGLHDTYLYEHDAEATERLARGYSPIFMRSVPFDDAPIYEGNKPAGYIISSIRDMTRWTGIQLGVVEVPEIYRSVIAKSHQGDLSVPAVYDQYYAAGWFVKESGNYIEHGGNRTLAILRQMVGKISIDIMLNYIFSLEIQAFSLPKEDQCSSEEYHK